MEREQFIMNLLPAGSGLQILRFPGFDEQVERFFCVHPGRGLPNRLQGPFVFV